MNDQPLNYIISFINCDFIYKSLGHILGSRNLAGRNDEDLDFFYRCGNVEDIFDNEFVLKQRRSKDRATAVFEEDLADLRRKRRDMQDRMFDMIDLNAEIEKAKNTLGAADNIFQRHALRFNNDNENIEQNMPLAQRLLHTHKVAAQEISNSKQASIKRTKPLPIEQGIIPLSLEISPVPPNSKINTFVDNPYINNELLHKRGYSKRKKSISF